MAGLKGICKHVRLDPMRCPHCNRSFRTQEVLGKFFDAILERAIAGKVVHIIGFGTFKARVHKGRTIITKLTAKLSPTGGVTFGDTMLLRFTLSPAGRRKMNEGFTPKISKKAPKKSLREAINKVVKRGDKKGE